MQYIITGKAPPGVKYELRRPGGYRGMIGAMFWTIDGDRDENYDFSNLVGPQLHGYTSGQRPKTIGGKMTDAPMTRAIVSHADTRITRGR
jgi:hypothetical protein